MMGQIEVLYDLGEPYVRLEDYRAVQARAATLAAEVERLEAESNELQTLLDGAEAERDEWMETAETTEGELGRFMDDLIAVVGDRVIIGDEVQFAEIVAAVAALRAQLAAREHAACPRCGQSLHGEKLLPF